MLLGADSIVVGRVLRPHGVEGAIVVELEDAEHGGPPGGLLLHAPRILLDGAPGTIPYRVAELRPFSGVAGPRRVWLRLRGLDSPERARLWAGARVRVERAFLEPLESGEHYARDVIGLECRSIEGRVLGRVSEVWPTPAGDQLLVEGADGPFFVPARERVLRAVDPVAGWIEVDLEALGFDPAAPGDSESDDEPLDEPTDARVARTERERRAGQDGGAEVDGGPGASGDDGRGRRGSRR